MIYEYIEIGGNELINPSRTFAYIQNELPELDVECDVPNIGSILGGKTYTNPASDEAPWVTSDPNSTEFYGAVPEKIEGLWDSTQTADVTELKQDGGVPGLRRNASREIRFTAVLYAKTDAALQYGIDWYIHALSGGYCPSVSVPYCEGEMLSVMPTMASMDAMAPLARHIYDVKTLQSVKVTDVLPFRTARAKMIEFILFAGNPFIYRAGVLADRTLESAGFTSDYTEVNCDPESEAYEQLISDPAQGDIVRPPRPPMVSPVNMPSSWRRNTVVFTEEELDLPGQSVFRIRVSSTGTLRMLRLRFYREESTEVCDYSGEFLITYKPPREDLIIDGVSRKIWVERGGQHIPAGNLVIGSDGRPARWPVLDCQQQVSVMADYPSAPSSVRVDIEAHNRR